jgi:serine/threonine protein kinase
LDATPTDDDDDTAVASDLYQNRFRMEGVAEYAQMPNIKLATDIKTNRKVALKFVANKEDFLNEVDLLRALRSEYVVEMFDYYEVSGSCCDLH